MVSQRSLKSHENMHQIIWLIPMAIKVLSVYDQEIPQSQTADNPVAPRGNTAQPSRETRMTN